MTRAPGHQRYREAVRIAAILLVALVGCASSRDGYYAAAWSPDGQILAIGTGHSLVLLDADTHDVIREFETGGTVHAVAFTADGSQVLYAGKGNTFTLARVDGTGNPVCHPQINPVVAFSAALTPDARTIVSRGDNGDLLVWRAPYSDIERRLTGGGYAWTYALTPDGTYALSVTPDGQVFRWNVHTGERDPLVNAHDSYVFAAVMDPNGRYFVTGGSARDQTVAIWNPGTFQIERRIDFGTVVRTLAITPDGTTLAVGGNRKTIHLYDLATGEPRGMIGGLPDWPSGMAFSPDSQRLFVTCPRQDANIYPRP